MKYLQTMFTAYDTKGLLYRNGIGIEDDPGQLHACVV